MDFAKKTFGAVGAVGRAAEEIPISLAAKPVQYLAKAIGQPDPYAEGVPTAIGRVTPSTATVKHTAGDALKFGSLLTGNPAASGALFGAGNSIGNDNDLLSLSTAAQTLLGAAGGKVLGWVGKPLLDTTGKVIGKITPQLLKNVVSNGTEAVTKFASQHNLPFEETVNKVTAPAVKATQAVTKGVSDVSRATGNAIKNQFPGLNPTEHFKAINERDIIAPTTVTKPAYSKATDIYNEAKRRGIDLGKLANQRGISHGSITDGNAFNTEDTATLLRKENYKASKDVLRPAIESVQRDVPPVPTSQIEGALYKRIHDMPSSQINDADRKALLERVQKTYGVDLGEGKDVKVTTSPAVDAHPNGYNLTDLFDSRIEAGGRVPYKPGGSPSTDRLPAKFAQQEEAVFRDLFDKNLPPDSGLNEVRKQFEENFMLADYLDALHTKTVPKGPVKKAVNLFGRGLGGVLGSKVAGFPGFLVGSRGGDILFNNFEALPNPIKEKVLQNAFKNRGASPAFDKLRKYLGDQESARLLQKLLPAKSSFKEVPPTLYTGKKVSTTPIKNEAFNTADVVSGKIKAPGTDRRLGSYLKKVQNARAADQQYAPEKTIDMGDKPKPKKTPKSLNDIKF